MLNNGTAWKIVMFLVGIILGGGAAGAVGHYQYANLRAEIRLDIKGLSNNVYSMDQRLSRIEGRLDVAE